MPPAEKAPAPPAPTPEYLDETLVPNVFAASIVSMVISGAFFAGRIVSRNIQRQSLKSSDWVLLGALCCCWGFCIIDMWMTSVGLGRHIEYVEEQDPDLSGIKLMLKVFIADEIFYDVGIALAKISVLLLYRGLFPGKKFALTTNILILVVIAWCISNLGPSIFSCRPIEGFWEIGMQPPPKCIDKTILYVTGSSINIATDLAILCLPIGKVMKLQLHQRTRIALCFVFLLGGLVCVVSAYRFTVLFESNSPDLTWEFAGVLNWSAGELATAIASASLPTMRPIFKYCLPKTWLPSRATNHYGVSTGNKTFGETDRHRSHGVSNVSSNAYLGRNSKFERLPDSHFASQTSGDSIKHDDDILDERDPRHRITVTQTFEMNTMKDVEQNRSHPDPRLGIGRGL